MKKVEATIKPFKLDEVRDALVGIGIVGMSVCEVRAFDPHRHPGCYRGTEFAVWFAPHIKIEVVVADNQAARCVDAIRHCAETRDADSGTIVVLPVEDSIQIRTGEHVARAA